ncbi:MAG: dihydrofolate reductase [Holosporaceae bacterium]|jgi:dihydrofolate reductase|nr:dihydrofolate reductase [Holosporaceae bacterium]
MIKLIVAVDSRWGIAKNGRIPWNLPWDRAFFRRTTLGSVVVMGRNTFCTLPNGPLDGRTNCVLSRTLASLDGTVIFRSLEDVSIQYDEFWLIGGAQLYNYSLANDLADYVLVTHVHFNYEMDSFMFPPGAKYRRHTLLEDKTFSVVEYQHI